MYTTALPGKNINYKNRVQETFEERERNLRGGFI